MASQGSLVAPVHWPSTNNLTRRNTTSTTGSAVPIPHGTWTVNISGNCSGCHHRHEAVIIQIKSSSDSDYVGEVYCDNCHRLWLGFGKRNSTRLSLISTKTIETHPIENEFRSALIDLVRSATLATTVASPSLAAIPESPTTGPSRETFVRSAIRNGIQRVRSTNSRVPSSPDTSSSGNNVNIQGSNTSVVPQAHQSGASPDGYHASKTTRLLSRLQRRIKRQFPKLYNSRLGRLLNSDKRPETSHMEQAKSPVEHSAPATANPKLTIPTPSIPSADCESHNTEPTNYANHPRSDTLVICGPSASPAQALDSLKSLDGSVLKEMSSEQRTAWMREQLTLFKSLHARYRLSITGSSMGNDGTDVDLNSAELTFIPSTPLLRRHSSALFGLGSHFGSFDYRDGFRGSDLSLYRRPLSMNDTDVSDTTAVETITIAPVSLQAVPEAPQRARRVSGSPRPPSLNNWQQADWNRAQARVSWGSSVTGGIGNIHSARGWSDYRHSIQSMTLDSTLLGSEPSLSQVQLPLPMNEETEQPSDNRQFPSPPPPADR